MRDRCGGGHLWCQSSEGTLGVLFSKKWGLYLRFPSQIPLHRAQILASFALAVFALAPARAGDVVPARLGDVTPVTPDARERDVAPALSRCPGAGDTRWFPLDLSSMGEGAGEEKRGTSSPLSFRPPKTEPCSCDT